MSLDYPEYEKLRKQSWLLGLLWRIGDWGYYLGLFGTLGSLLMAIYSLLTTQKDNFSWYTGLVAGLLPAAFFACIFWTSSLLKNFALTRGEALKNQRRSVK
jgi:hypothetical protein